MPLLLLSLVLVTALGPSASAEPIRLDLVRGPILSSSRITGMGGAFTGVALGIDGASFTPAALGHRPESSTDWFDWDLGFGLLVVPGRDVDWNGDGYAPGHFAPDEASGLEFQAVNLGLLLQGGPVGLGVYTDIYGWQSGDVSVSHVDANIGIGLALWDGHVILGLAAQVAALTVASADSSTSLEGLGPDVGVLVRPPTWPFAFGVRFRPTILLESDQPGSPYLGVLPWQLSVGASYRLTPDGRAYNRPHREALPPLDDRRYLLVALDLVAMGAAHGVTLEGLVRRPTSGIAPRIESGLGPSLGLRMGGEGEVIDNRLRARFGTYLEPIRVADEPALRLHLTGGFELRLFELLLDWQLDFSFDVSPGWSQVSFGVGIW
jgi:hypothetical protein